MIAFMFRSPRAKRARLRIPDIRAAHFGGAWWLLRLEPGDKSGRRIQYLIFPNLLAVEVRPAYDSGARRGPRYGRRLPQIPKPEPFTSPPATATPTRSALLPMR